MIRLTPSHDGTQWEFTKMRSYLNTIAVMHNILCTASNKWSSLGTYLSYYMLEKWVENVYK